MFPECFSQISRFVHFDVGYRIGFRGDTRGASEVIGVVLMIGFSVVVTTAVLITGLGFLSSSQAQINADHAVQSFQVLDGDISGVAFDASESKSTTLGLRAGRLSTSDTGVFQVQVLNQSTGKISKTIAEERLGTVEYRVSSSGQSKTVVYQGGGVWMQSGGNENSTVVKSLPEMHYDGETLTVPLIAINHSASKNNVGNRVTVEKQETRRLYPNESQGGSNPVVDKKIQLSYAGEYYMAWTQVFESRFKGDVVVDHATESVSIVLVTPDLEQQVNSGLQAGGSATDSIFIRGSGGSPSFVDSYNSSEGAYSLSSASDGVVRSGGDITLRGDATIKGDAVVPDGYYVDVGGGSEVTGEIRHESVTGAAIDSGVRSRCSAFASSNDNAVTAAIDGESLNSSMSSWTLESGTYYLGGDLDVGSGESLELDNSGGSVDLCVQGDISVSGGSVDVVDGSGGRVNVYQIGDSFSVTNGGSVSVPGDVSTKLWFYGLKTTDVNIKNSRVVGVVYMPAGDAGSGSATIMAGGEVFGAVVSGPIEMKSGGVVHYDQAVVGAEATRGLDSLPVVAFLHVSVTEVEFTE